MCAPFTHVCVVLRTMGLSLFPADRGGCWYVCASVQRGAPKTWPSQQQAVQVAVLSCLEAARRGDEKVWFVS